MPALRPIHVRTADPSAPSIAGILVPTTGLEEVYDWRAEFGRPGPIKLEIGPGKGIWLTRMAAQEPESNWLAIEYKEKRARWVAEKAARRDLKNVRVIWEDAAEALTVLFAEGAVDEIYINFPDPWPKRRHSSRRLIQPKFCHVLARALRPGGLLQIVTDVGWYARHMVKCLEELPLLRNEREPGYIAPHIEGYVPSIHFEKFADEGRTFNFVRYRRRE